MPMFYVIQRSNRNLVSDHIVRRKKGVAQESFLKAIRLQASTLIHFISVTPS